MSDKTRGKSQATKGQSHPKAASAPPANLAARAARANPAPPAPPAKTAPRSPAKSTQKERAKKNAAADDARADALAEAQGIADAVDNSRGSNDPTPPPSPPPRREDRSVTVELNKERSERAKLQAETERLRLELETLKAKKRKESDAAESAPPAKRAVGSGRRSSSSAQGASVSRKRQSVYLSIFCFFGYIIMTPLFIQGGDTEKATLLGKLGGQEIMRHIQSCCVSWLVNLLGIRWSGSLFRGQVAPIVQHLVIKNQFAGIDSIDKYNACKHAVPKSEFYFLQVIQQTQNKTAKQHRDKIREIIMDFFSQTSDKMINTIKQELFNVAGGAPIVGSDHPVLQEMMAVPAPVRNGIACMHPSPARTAAARHARMRICLCTRTDHVVSFQASTFSLRPSETSKMTELRV